MAAAKVLALLKWKTMKQQKLLSPTSTKLKFRAVNSSLTNHNLARKVISRNAASAAVVAVATKKAAVAATAAVETVAVVVAMAAVETVAVAVVDITGIIDLRDIHTF